MAKPRLVDQIGNFTAIPNSFIKSSLDLSSHSFRVFVLLRFLTNSETETAFPSFDAIKHMTGLHRRHIAASLRELELAGWLTRQKRFGKSTVYTLTDPTRKDQKSKTESYISNTTSGTTEPRISNSNGGTNSNSNGGTTASMYMNKTDITNTLAATPHGARPKGEKARCPRCKASVPILASKGEPCAWCLTCGIDALAAQEVSVDVNSDAAKCVEFFKHLVLEIHGYKPHVTKGKDFAIIKGLVGDYGKTKVQSLLRLFVASSDERVKDAGYAIAFFSARVNSLLASGGSAQVGCDVCRNDPNRTRYNLKPGMTFDIQAQTARRCACNRKANGKTYGQSEAPTGGKA